MSAIGDDIPCFKGYSGAVEAARELGMPDHAVTIRACRMAVQRGELSARLIGNAYWFSLAAIREWLANGGPIEEE